MYTGIYVIRALDINVFVKDGDGFKPLLDNDQRCFLKLGYLSQPLRFAPRYAIP